MKSVLCIGGTALCFEGYMVYEILTIPTPRTPALKTKWYYEHEDQLERERVRKVLMEEMKRK